MEQMRDSEDYLVFGSFSVAKEFLTQYKDGACKTN